MKPSYFTILLIIVLCQLHAQAQKENNIWTMGPGFGFDFNAPGPAKFINSINTLEAAASVCDKSGGLLFYTDGIVVFDNTHTIMPNGTGLGGCTSSTQGATIAQIIGHDSLYFLFTLNCLGTSGDLRYSIINMKLNGGKGDIISGKKIY